MLDPFELNTLEEAANWLSEITKTKVSAKHVLNAEIKHYKNIKPFNHHRPPQSRLYVAFSKDTEFGLYGTDLKFKRYVHWKLAPMYMVHLWELLIHGETRVSVAQYPDDSYSDGESYILIEPALTGQVADLSMIRIKESDLKCMVNELSNIKGDNLKLTPVQQDKITCQSEAKKLWEENPNLTQAQIKKADKIASYLNLYKGKNTVSSWLSEIDPRPKKSRLGRPKNTTSIS